MLYLHLLAVVLRLQSPATQPPADELLDDRGFAQALAHLETSPRVRVETIGWSHQGRPVVLIIIGLPEALARAEDHRRRAIEISEPRIVRPSLGSTSIEGKDLEALLPGAHLPVIFAGGSWGHEAAHLEGLLKAARTLAFEESDEVRRALSSTLALIIPLMNPDGRALALDEWKKTPLSSGESGAGNAYGFLLNRDFIHATQPEARAVIETTTRWRPAAGVDLHEDMLNMGVSLPDLCFVEPFVRGLDVEEHPITRGAIVSLGTAIAGRWRSLGFRALFNAEGDNRFAPLPEPGKGINPLAGSAGRLNLMWTLHGIPGFIIESARTPGSQSWEDRVKQKASAVLATLLEVSAHAERYARAVYQRRLAEAGEGGNRFVVIPEQGQPRDGLEEILDLLRLHRVSSFRTRSPYPAFVVPLMQAEARMVRHLLLAERSKLNPLPAALGVRIQLSESLPEAERRAFLAAPLEPAVLPPAAPAEEAALAPEEKGPFAARPTVRATALVNQILASRSASVFQAEGSYVFAGQSKTIFWQAARIGVPLQRAAHLPRSAARSLGLPQVALYAGQGVSRIDWGELAWALERAALPYRLIDAGSLPAHGLDGADLLLVPNGSAAEIVDGWNPESPGRRRPWEPAEPRQGIGQQGLSAIRSFVEGGGTYVGLGGGGAFLAGKEFLGLVNSEMIPSSVGVGPVRLRPAQPQSPLLFGYAAQEPLTAFFYAPPGSAERGFAFRAGSAAVALYDGAEEFPEERSFLSTAPLAPNSGTAAILHERRGRGQVILFGIAPAFRGQWKSSFRLLYNALYLATEAR